MRLIALCTATIILCLALAGYAYSRLMTWNSSRITLMQPQVIEFAPGTTLRELSKQLGAKGLLTQPPVFNLWVRLFEDYSRFQAGTYRFEGEVAPSDIIAALTQGRSPTYALEFTIPEGFSYHQIAEKLADKGVGTKEEFQSLMHDAQFIGSLNLPSQSLEGFVYPATYRFSKMPSAREALSKAVKTFWEKLPRDYEQEVRNRGLSLVEAVTFASLVESETPHDEEKPLVAEVIWNRLHSNMPLGIDAAIIYGIEDYQGDLKKKHLLDATNRYNTRIHLGLPPTPISSPSLVSLQAVLTPSQAGNMFYVLDRSTERYHHFSKTIEEHNLYVKKLVENPGQ